MLLKTADLYKPEILTLIWALIYSSDWLMDWWGALIYNRKVKEFCRFEKGYNVKAISEFEIHHQGILFLRYASELFITSLSLWIILYSCRLMASWKFYEFFCGFFILLEACVHFRHIRNVAIFSLINHSFGMEGSIFVPKWISLRFAFIEFTTFALMLMIVYLFDPKNLFTFGGIMSCMFSALFHLALANREYRLFKKSQNG